MIGTVIMLLTAVLLLVLGYLIYDGKTYLIHSYHQKKVTDKANYGKSMGKAIIGIGVSALCSGLLGFIPRVNEFVTVGVFLLGFGISFYYIWKAQRKYNGGMF